MSTEKQQSADWPGDLLDSPYFQHILTFTVSRNVRTEKCYNAIIETCEDPSDIDQLRIALFYLEHLKWDQAQAHLLMELDHLDRKAPPLDGKRNVVSNHNNNLKLDRRLLTTTDTLNNNAFEVKIVTGNTTRTFTYPNASTFNRDEQNQLDDLNRWRHQIIRQHVGLPKMERYFGQNFHPLELTYLLNRYARQEIDERGRCRYEEVLEDYNAVFEGVYLPGVPKACPKRTQDSITSLLTRKAINPKESGRQWPRYFNGVMRHRAAQARIQQEWQEKLAINQENGNENEEEGHDNGDGVEGSNQQ